AILNARVERVDGHVVGRDRVLVRFQDERPGRSGRLVAGDDVVAHWRDALALGGHAERAEELLEVSRDAMLVEFGALEVSAHGIDAGNGDEVAKQTRGFVHDGPPGPAAKAEWNSSLGRLYVF